MLSVRLFHMGNTAPSGIVLCTGELRLSVCERALLNGDFSTCTTTKPQFGGAVLRTRFSLSLPLNLTLFSMFALLPIPFFLNFSQSSNPKTVNNYTVNRCYELHDHFAAGMMDPRRQPLIRDYSAAGHKE